MPAELLIRKATPRDAARLREFFKRQDERIAEPSRLEEFLRSRDRHYLVAELGGRLVGVHGMRLDYGGEKSGYMQLVVVDAAMRRRGIGNKLVKGAIALLRGKGMKQAWLETDASNENLVRMARKHGFREFERLAEEYGDEGAIVRMRKGL